jgi:hypothetical protein
MELLSILRMRDHPNKMFFSDALSSRMGVETQTYKEPVDDVLDSSTVL